MRITLALDTLAVGVAVCVVVSSTSASGVRQASTAIASDTSIDHARILQTTDGADEASEEARIPSLSRISSAFHSALKGNLLPEKVPLLKSQSSDVSIEDVPIKDVLDKDASIKDAFSTLGLGEVNPLTESLTDALNKIQKKVKDADYWREKLEKLDSDSPDNWLPKPLKVALLLFRMEAVRKSYQASLKAYQLRKSALDKECQAVVKYLGKDEFKTWLDHASTKSGGGSPTVGAYQTFRDTFGELKAAAIIELSLLHEPGYSEYMWTQRTIEWTPELLEMGKKAAANGKILQKEQFDHWYSTKHIKTEEEVFELLRPSKGGGFKVPFVLIRRTVDSYEEHFNGKNSEERFERHVEE